MRYDAERKERTRERVVQEATRTIRKEGLAKLGVASVMAQAGLTHGGFYAHFKSRDELLSAAIDQMLAELRDLFESRTTNMPPKEALRSYIGFYLSPAHRDARGAGCPLPVLSSDLPRMDEAARQKFAAGLAWLTDGIEQLLEALGHTDAEDLASSTLSEMVGALILSRAAPGRERSDAILARSRAATFNRLGLN